MFHRSVALAVAMIFAMLAPSQPFPLSPPAQLHGAPRFRAGPRPQRALQLCMQRKPWERDEASQRGNTGTAVSNKKVSIGTMEGTSTRPRVVGYGVGGEESQYHPEFWLSAVQFTIFNWKTLALVAVGFLSGARRPACPSWQCQFSRPAMLSGPIAPRPQFL
mgnify:CR=1 FL=1|jgi:hypothetical protein